MVVKYIRLSIIIIMHGSSSHNNVFRPQKQSVGRSPHKSYKVTQMQTIYLPHLFIDTTKPYFMYKDDQFSNEKYQ